MKLCGGVVVSNENDSQFPEALEGSIETDVENDGVILIDGFRAMDGVTPVHGI